MVSVITDRISGVVDGAPVNPGSILSTSNVAGVNAITADAFPEIMAYYAGLLVLIRPANINTGAVTLDLGPGAIPWHKPAGGDFGNGDLSPGLEYLLKMSADKTEFRTIAPSF